MGAVVIDSRSVYKSTLAHPFLLGQTRKVVLNGMAPFYVYDYFKIKTTWMTILVTHSWCVTKTHHDGFIYFILQITQLSKDFFFDIIGCDPSVYKTNRLHIATHYSAEYGG